MIIRKVILMFALPSLCWAGSIEDSRNVHNLLTKLHLDSDKPAASKMGIQIAKSLPDGSPLLPTVRKAIESAASTEILDSEKEKEVQFATGTKTDTYCKGVGLVLMDGQHANGTQSRMILTVSNRKMDKDQYSIMKDGGEWAYELENAYRAPVISEIFQPWGRAKGYDLIEIRKNKNGKVDKGLWQFEWSNPSRSKWSVNGEPLEPVKLYMAVQFHRWGSPDLGYELKFEKGYSDSRKQHINGNTAKRINLRSKRLVKNHLPVVTYTDSKGKEYTHLDCWEVESKIRFIGFGKL